MASATVSLPILDSKNWKKWVVRMHEIFGFHGVLEMVQRGIQEEEGSASYKKSKKRDYKALFIIHQCVDEMNFWRISAAQSTKEAWKILNKAHGGAVQNKAHGGADKEKCNREKRPSNTESRVKKNDYQEDTGSTQQILGEVKKNSPTEKRRAPTKKRSAQDPEPVCEEEPSKSDDVVVETVRGREPREEDKQCSNLGIFEIRVLKKQSLASDDEPNTAPTESNQNPQHQEPQFSDLGEISETRVFRIRVSQDVFSAEKKVDLRVSRRLNHKQNLNLHQSNPMIVNRTILIRKKNLKKKIVRGERVRGTVTVEEGDSPEVVFTESQRQCLKRVSATSSSVRAVRTSAVSSLASLGRATPWRVCVREKKKSVRVVPLSKLGEISETRVCWHLSFAEVCVMREKKLQRAWCWSIKEGDENVEEERMRAMAASVEKKSTRGAHGKEQKEKRKKRPREFVIRKLGQADDLVGLAQFLQHSGQGGVAMKKSGVAEKLITLGQSDVSIDQAQYLQKSEWIHVGLQTKQWDPGIILLFQN